MMYDLNRVFFPFYYFIKYKYFNNHGIYLLKDYAFQIRNFRCIVFYLDFDKFMIFFRKIWNFKIREVLK